MPKQIFSRSHIRNGLRRVESRMPAAETVPIVTVWRSPFGDGGHAGRERFTSAVRTAECSLYGTSAFARFFASGEAPEGGYRKAACN